MIQHYVYSRRLKFARLLLLMLSFAFSAHAHSPLDLNGANDRMSFIAPPGFATGKLSESSGNWVDPTILYVKQGGTGSGISWADASGNLQAVIDSSPSGSEIWVAAGTYQRAGGQSFTMKQGVVIYGGFAPTGTPTFAERNATLYPAILQGNNASVISNDNNGLTATAILDGFTITGGVATNGGGISNINSYPLIVNCIVKNNTASNWGGGLYNQGGGSTSVISCLFYSNTSTGGGAAFDYDGARTSYLNTTIANNNSTGNGGGIHTYQNTNITLVNSIVYNNTASSSGSQLFSGGGCSVTANYSLFIYNRSTVSGTLRGTNNVSGDPLFTNAPAGIYTISAGGAAFNTGNSAAFSNASTSKDLGNDPRIFSQSIDMGAYEAQILPIRYVKQGATGDGESWADASGSPQDMINASVAGVQVWVAAGTYQPSNGQSFSMKEGVKIYGGFTATGNPVFTDRDPTANVTTLQGNNASVIRNNNNGLTTASVLDGFTISNGSGSHGGGIFNNNVSPTFVNLSVKNNFATTDGGGIYISGGSTVVTNVSITGNTVGSSGNNVRHGGGIYAYGASPVLTNVLVANNTIVGTGGLGGGFNFTLGSPTMVNVTVAGNSAATGSGLYSQGATPQIRNSVLWNNTIFVNGGIPAYSNSIVAGSGGSSAWNSTFGTDSGSNIDTDPQFINPGGGDYRLSNSSPGRNAGNNSFFINAYTSNDLAGSPRIFNVTIDMGAYENQQYPSATGAGIFYVVKGAIGNGTSWGDALGEFAAALLYAKIANDNAPGTVKEIWVAKGTYKPMYRADNLNGTDPADRNNTFLMVEGVKIYGHFAGNESSVAQRNLSSTGNETIVTGDFLANDTPDANGIPAGNFTENAYHVVVASGITAGLLDGFTIIGGYGDSYNSITINNNAVRGDIGAGILASNTGVNFTNLMIRSNVTTSGGGLYLKNYAGTASKLNIHHNKGQFYGGVYIAGGSGVLEYSTISNNYGLWDAGGIGVASSAAFALRNLIISNNRTEETGGGMSIYDSATMNNILITGNSASEGGGIMMWNFATMVNCTITGNVAPLGSAVSVNGSWGNLSLQNSVMAFNGNDPVYQVFSNNNGMVIHTNNLVQGSGGSNAWNGTYGSNAGGNIDADPLFTDAANGDYRPLGTSPAINAGDSGLYQGAESAQDLRGFPRVHEGQIDLGVYERVVNEEGIMYVVKGEDGDGTGWDNALGELADALKAAKVVNYAQPNTVKQIWVAKGTYKPMYRADNIYSTNATDRTNTFLMVDGVKVYGHFEGGENALTERGLSIAANETILSGDFNGDDATDVNGVLSGGYSDNALHVVLAPGVATGALDGFTIQGGNSSIYSAPVINGYSVNNSGGGGIYATNTDVLFTNLNLHLNAGYYGGGIYLKNYSGTASALQVHHNMALEGGGGMVVNASPGLIDDSTISNNYTASFGGGLLVYTSGNIRNLVISNNRAQQGAGGVDMYGACSFYNLLIKGNTAPDAGGMMIDAGTVLTNCTIVGNMATRGSALSCYNNVTYLRNCIVANNGTQPENQIYRSNGNIIHTNNLLKGSGGSSAWNGNFGTDNGGNIDSDPLFTDPANEDYTLQGSSPAINAGVTAHYLNAAAAEDLAGNPRLAGDAIDMGAYEQRGTDCTITTTWNGTAWTNGTPASYEYSAVIAGNYTSAGNITACSLTVNSGTVVVNAGHTFTIKGAVTVTGGSVTINNNAALVQVDDTANTGNIVVIKNSNPLFRLDYTLWSSPVSAQTVGDFSPQTSTGRFYEYKYDFDAAANGGAGGDVEQYFIVPATTIFEPAKGYLIRMPNGNLNVPGYNGGTGSYSYEGTFTGIPHNGIITKTASVQGNRYTAVGNPYPSPISVVDFFNGNTGVIDNTSSLYFWRKRNNSGMSSYASLNLTGFTANQGQIVGSTGGQSHAGFYPNTSVNDNLSWLISQGQGFIVKTKANPTVSDISFTNGMRRAVPANGQQAFFRTAAATMSRFWLNLTDTEGGFSQALVAYSDATTTGLDYGYDGKLLNDSGRVALYSIAEDTNLTIQARAAFAQSDVVPMGFTATAAGQYTINLDRVDGLFEQGQGIYLKDNLLGTITSLISAYTFTSEAGTFNNRFEIVYTAQALGTGIPQLYANSVVVFKEGTTININTGTAAITSVNIFDMRGRQLYTKSGVNATEMVVSGLQVQQQILIVEINTVKGKVSKRIVY